MAANVIFDYQAIGNAANAIRTTHADNYASAAATFKSAMETAIADWTGESKLRFVEMLTNVVYPHLDTAVPGIVTALADVLDGNGQSMADTDAAIAQQIPNGAT